MDGIRYVKKEVTDSSNMFQKKVTVFGKSSVEMPTGTLKSIFKQAQLNEK